MNCGSMSVVGGTKLIALSRPFKMCCLITRNFMVFYKKVNGNSSDSLTSHRLDLNGAEEFYGFLLASVCRYFLSLIHI